MDDDKIVQLPPSDLDQRMEDVFKQLRELSSEDLRNFSRAYIMLKNSDEAATLHMTVGEQSCDMLLINVEVIAMFIDFLEQTIEYYKEN